MAKEPYIAMMPRRFGNLINLYFLAITTLLATYGLAEGKIIVRERTEFYAVTGSSGEELARSMLSGARGPINMRHAIAATEAAYTVGDANIVVRRGRCVVESVEVVLDLTYYLPRWADKGRGSSNLRARWKSFYAELVRHEKQHGRIAREGAAELERALLSISGTTAFDCNDFGAFSTLRLNWLSNRIRQRQLAFDRRENLRSSRISQLQSALIRAR